MKQLEHQSECIENPIGELYSTHTAALVSCPGRPRMRTGCVRRRCLQGQINNALVPHCFWEWKEKKVKADLEEGWWRRDGENTAGTLQLC